MWYSNLQVGRIAAATVVLTYHTIAIGRTSLGVDVGLHTTTTRYYIGVGEVFLFALSGFVLARNLQSGTPSLYVVFRLLRLYPAYWLAIAGVLLIRIATGRQSPLDGGLFLRAIFLIPGPDDGEHYHPSYSLGIEWTLMYEVFLSMMLVPLAALGRKWGVFLGSAVWAAACIAHEAVDPGPLRVFPKPLELPLSAINTPFLFGVLAYFTHEHWGRFKVWILLAGMVSLTAGALFYPAQEGWSYIIKSAGIATIVGYVAAIRQIDAKHPIAAAGEWTYGLYLIHSSILVLVFRTASDLPWVPRTSATLLFGWALAFLVGSAYGEFEWRFYRWAQRRIKGATVRRALEPPAP